MCLCVCVCALCIFIFPVRASAVLAQLKPSVAELLGGRDLVLPFSGIGHFRKEVVFVELAPGRHTHTLESLAGQSPQLHSLCLTFYFFRVLKSLAFLFPCLFLFIEIYLCSFLGVFFEPLRDANVIWLLYLLHSCWGTCKDLSRLRTTPAPRWISFADDDTLTGRKRCWVMLCYRLVNF